jgi:hypothetical protein
LENTTTKLKSTYCVTAVIYARKYIIKLCGKCYKTFFGVIYATIGIFPYDLYRRYASSNVIKNKSFITYLNVNVTQRSRCIIS